MDFYNAKILNLLNTMKINKNRLKANIGEKEEKGGNKFQVFEELDDWQWKD